MKSEYEITGRTRLNTIKMKEISRALTEEDRGIIIKNINTDMLYSELDKRIITASRIIDMLRAELNTLNEESTLQDYERTIKNCGLVLKKGKKMYDE